MLNVYLANIKDFNDAKIESMILNSSSFRLNKYNAATHPEIKKESIVATYLIDKHLKKIGLREQDMLYKLSRNGKPSFENHYEINFSISHSKDLVIVAFSDVEVGCDIQVVKNIDDAIFSKVLSKEEREIIHTGNDNSLIDRKLQLEKFFYYWVKKEAILKRDGVGLTDSISKVDDNFGMVKKIIYNKSTEQISEMKDIVSINDIKNDECLSQNECDIYYMCINNGKNSNFSIIL